MEDRGIIQIQVNMYENFKVEKYNFNSYTKYNMQILTRRKKLGCGKNVSKDLLC